MKPSERKIRIIMLQALRELWEEGRLNEPLGDNADPSEIYKFRARDVAAIHTHKEGVGDGIWFRLRDGRVVDKAGEPSESDIALYDTVHQ